MIAGVFPGQKVVLLGEIAPAVFVALDFFTVVQASARDIRPSAIAGRPEADAVEDAGWSIGFFPMQFSYYTLLQRNGQ